MATKNYKNNENQLKNTRKSIGIFLLNDLNKNLPVEKCIL